MRCSVHESGGSIASSNIPKKFFLKNPSFIYATDPKRLRMPNRRRVSYYSDSSLRVVRRARVAGCKVNTFKFADYN